MVARELRIDRDRHDRAGAGALRHDQGRVGDDGTVLQDPHPPALAPRSQSRESGVNARSDGRSSPVATRTSEAGHAASLFDAADRGDDDGAAEAEAQRSARRRP